MTTEQLKYFLITAKHLNFSAAAKELYVTQPAISHQISALEKELGTLLFTRSTRKIQLTKSGELFLEDAKRMLDMEEAAKERLQLADNTADFSLKIAYLLAPCQFFLPKLLVDFRKQYPQVEISLHRMDAHDIVNAMQTDHHDLYFSMSKDLLANPEYAYKDVFEDTYCLICSDDHPCAKVQKIDFNKLASERFLLIDPETAPYMSKQIHQICRSMNFRPRVTNTLSSMDEILFEVEAGLGVSILPLKNKFYTPSSLVYIPLTGNYTKASIGVAWEHTADNPAIGWFLNTLDQFILKHSDWF